ncbi:MAG: patatin-like phospholipase family protein [Syntrophomonadaceae bacterium]|jgi:NTE family protein
MKQLGVALGGGGLKGLAHIGVLQVLQEHKIPIHMISGTSAGSIIAALYASGMSPYQMEKIALDVKTRDYIDPNLPGLVKFGLSLFFSKYSSNFSGLLKGEKIEKMVKRLTKGKSLRELRMPLAIIACDIDTGKEVVFTNQNLIIKGNNTTVINDILLSKAVRASISIPATFEPVKINGSQMVDGGIKSIVPVEILKAMGANFILAVNLGTNIYHRKVEGILQIIARTIDILTYETSDTSEKLYSDMIVFPKLGDIQLDDLEKAPWIIRCGRRAMQQKIKELSSKLGLP